MGREIKRVPANFDWPISQIWKGYVNPYRGKECYTCRNGYSSDGLSPAAREIADSFYDLKQHRGGPDGRSARAWADKITQEEVNLLVDKGRLRSFGTEVRVSDANGNFDRWDRVLNADGTPYYPTAEEVNAWERGPGMGHDAINRWILVEHRLKQAEIVGDLAVCSVCKGETVLWTSEKIKQQSMNFSGDGESEPDPSIGEIWTEPPTGDWWQVWETVSEGSPVSPAFATADELIDYLVEGGDAWCRDRNAKSPFCRDKPPSREDATKFVKGSGWVPSGAATPETGWLDGIHDP